MKGYNVIAVFNETADQWLMCRRKKNPFKGLSNLVGGKIEPGEDGMTAAYRELQEETGITKDNIELHHLADFTYYYSNLYLEVWVGRVNQNLEVAGDENELYWSELNCNFFDMDKYAGNGNIGHILEEIKYYWKQLLKLE
ncbi:MAG: NUDIX hydrolase [Firmicutes bacterium]|nr:NUDIX hydrolase [Bacillota bacterium]